MSGLSFDIKNSSDFLKKLLEDYEEYQKDYTSSRVAINCAMTSWHLIDWIYFEFMKTKQYPNISDFQNEVKALCPELQIMQDITNSSKHHTLRKTPSIETTGLHDGDFDGDDFSNDFDTPGLEIIKKDGTILYFDEEIEKVINFWNAYLTEQLKINIQ